MQTICSTGDGKGGRDHCREDQRAASRSRVSANSFRLWTTANEKAFVEFFRTEEFSELQGLVLDAAIDCRKEFQQLMEVSLKEYPIALRSELDDVCKTNYTLNKSVQGPQEKECGG